ncbi:hypothetical protein [Microbacterium sp. MMO-10]|uniref:hypothetical protein n=1 Tax=Microbacterium sp. MMO-10 TaxID=3081272 RepID=UPI003016D214
MTTQTTLKELEEQIMKCPVDGAGLHVADRSGVEIPSNPQHCDAGRDRGELETVDRSLNPMSPLPSHPGYYPPTNERGYQERSRKDRPDWNSRDQHGRGARPRRARPMVLLSPSDRSFTRWRTPLRTLQRALATVAVFIALTIGSSIGDTASASPRAVESPTPMATQTPPPSPSDDLDHPTPNEEQRVRRDDLALIGVTFVIGLAFILAAGALGVLAVARERRRIDRASTAKENEASNTP